MSDETKVEKVDYRIDYLEFLAPNVAGSKKFYGDAFGWTFEDWGPGYASFGHENVAGGFTNDSPSKSGAPLVILFASKLEEAQARVESAGGKIVKPIFAFPGGRRFHFTDPAGNELAIWSDK
jgi:uncharacterized protein